MFCPALPQNPCTLSPAALRAYRQGVSIVTLGPAGTGQSSLNPTMSRPAGKRPCWANSGPLLSPACPEVAQGVQVPGICPTSLGRPCPLMLPTASKCYTPQGQSPWVFRICWVHTRALASVSTVIRGWLLQNLVGVGWDEGVLRGLHRCSSDCSLQELRG